MLVVNPAYKAITEDWFDPEYWGWNARPVSTGGRGSAWFVDSDQGGMVLRHYRRGGLVARLSEKSYIYLGHDRTRSFREFHLLKALYDRGLPVPEPVAAWSKTHNGVCYRASIIIRRIDGAEPWPEVVRLDDEGLWHRIGGMIRRFHDAGLDHVDLNCDNILVAGDDVYLIDLDRCRLRPGTAGGQWQRANLRRLWRSVVKRMSKFTETQRDSLWECLMAGYHKHPLSGPESGNTVL
ncbi:3-deoxy-D-manno-octulosonic acid kinase [Marinobacter sp. M1N3S26]|uniref:3-deoxy-D-manno-octulosonic acid kinase n=1 Tax=unclassified Marinobacter TaxID=83889 RepID=UPI00387B93F5